MVFIECEVRSLVRQQLLWQKSIQMWLCSPVFLSVVDNEVSGRDRESRLVDENLGEDEAKFFPAPVWGNEHQETGVYWWMQGRSSVRVGERPGTPWFWKYLPGSMCPSTMIVSIPFTEPKPVAKNGRSEPSFHYIVKSVTTEEGRTKVRAKHLCHWPLERWSIHCYHWPAEAGDGWLLFTFRKG